MKTNAAEVTELDSTDTMQDIDPWAQALEMLSAFGITLKEVTKDIKGIKRELRVLNSNLNLVHQDQIESKARLSLLESQCPKRNGTCPADLSPLPHPYTEDCSSSE